MILFDRSASLVIGDEGQPGLSIQGLRIVFTVKKNSTSESNLANIEVYNLSESRRNQIKEMLQLVILKAGYISGEGEKVVFVGDTTNTTTRYEAPNVITKIDANDGEKKIRSFHLSISYQKGSSAKKILQDVIKRSNFPLKAFDWGTVADKTYNNGFAFVGAGKVLLTNVANYLGLEWSVQNNELKLVKKEFNDQALIIKLSPSSGLIGSPERLENITDSEKKEKAIRGWKIKSLLSPGIEPGGVISVESREIPVGSLFRVVEVEHRGDTHGDEWITETTVTAI